MTNFRQSLRPALFLVVILLAACGGGGGGSPGPSPTLAPTSTPTVPGASPTPKPTPTVPGASPTPVPTLPPQASRLIVPATGAYLGAYVNTSTATSTPLPNPPSDESELINFESQVGRKMALTQHYYAWTDTFPGPAVPVDYSEGRVPILSWGCGDTDANVAAGLDDASIVIPTANRLKALGKPIFLRWFWDMNTPTTAHFRNSCDDTPGQSGVVSSSEYVLAWQHIWSVFQAQGATNVIFVWAPSGAAGVAPSAPYYPGAAYVDWIGIDRFDYQSLPFANTYTAAYQQLSGYVKPIMIAETGAVATAQQSFFAPASGPSDVTTLQTQLPFVKAYVLYDGLYVNYQNTIVDYILVDPTATGSFGTFANNPYFAPFPNLSAP